MKVSTKTYSDSD